MPVLKNIAYLATCKMAGAQDDIHAIEQAALVWQQDRIVWLGKECELPAEYNKMEVIDAEAKLVIPGLIDCHTHLAFGGWRPQEFEQRILKKSYLEIAKAGGGINSTVAATRKASDQELYAKCLSILDEMALLGVTTLECKSGYGLNLEDELRILTLYKRLNKEHKLSLVPTFLGAHTIPLEYKDKRKQYIELLTKELIPQVAEEKLAKFCDVFVEDSAFSVDEARVILEVATKHGLLPKLHVDQLSDGGGASLAAELKAVSAEHLEFVSDKAIKQLAKAQVVAVILPLASLYTFEQALDARRLIDAGVHVAVSTDFNPGSAPSSHLPLAMMLACTLNRLTPQEALKGATIYAAKALCLEKEIGSLEIGKKADFLVLNTMNPTFWLYNFQANTCLKRIKNGEILENFR